MVVVHRAPKNKDQLKVDNIEEKTSQELHHERTPSGEGIVHKASANLLRGASHGVKNIFAHHDPKKSDLDLEKIYMQTPTPTETKEFVEEKLAQFNESLDHIPAKKKEGYLMAKQKYPQACGDNFKLIFLRCEVFLVKQAVTRWILYWNTRLQIFGQDKAFLPMTLDGAIKDNKDAIECRYLQVANVTDPDGRAIVFLDLQKEADNISSEGLLRAVWYQAHVALEHETTQMKGVVILIRCVQNLSEWRVSLSKSVLSSAQGILPIRVAALHVISPPAFINYIVRVVKVMLTKKMKHRIYLHPGNIDEILHSLSKFGLDSKHVPQVLGGQLTFV